ncbi:pentapeptide repeat-containing protein [Nostoc punctiforme UO1]|uniref:pentapeptide repeat-containing protein n=1 Tax=Nostoc punctiforme TaxID=272131 RepID=UPI0030AAC7D1
MPQDFCGQDLSGRSFKGQNLEGENFSGADIRSADFSGANLKGANFSSAKAGLQWHWVIGLIIILWLLAGISGVLSEFISYSISATFRSSNYEQFYNGVVSLILIIAIWIMTISQGLLAGFGILVAALVVTLALALVRALALTLVRALPGVLAATLPGALPGSLAIVLTGFVVGNLALAIAIAGVLAVTLSGSIAGAIVLAGALLGSLAVVGTLIVAGATALTLARALVLIVVGALFSAYIAWRAMIGDEKYSLIRNIAVAFAAYGGTSFYNANLSDVDFTAAILKNTNFRKAVLIRTCFLKAKKLDLIRPGTSYLRKLQVRQVLVTGQGQDKNFDREDLRGVNFQGANLVNTSFIGADLSHANFQDADLTRAKLVQTQLDGTDFTGATLTGAYIEDWNITTDTKFDGVCCEYVYMRLPTTDNPDPHRKPDNRQEVFADGEFGDFIKPIFDTLDLYHNQGVDPRAIAISFKQLAENHPDAELEIMAIEKRSENNFLLRAKTVPTANKSQLTIP